MFKVENNKKPPQTPHALKFIWEGLLYKSEFEVVPCILASANTYKEVRTNGTIWDMLDPFSLPFKIQSSFFEVVHFFQSLEVFLSFQHYIW